MTKYTLLLLLVIPFIFGCEHIHNQKMFDNYADSTERAFKQWECCFSHNNDYSTRYWDKEFKRYGDSFDVYKKRLYPNGTRWEREEAESEKRIKEEESKELQKCNCK